MRALRASIVPIAVLAATLSVGLFSVWVKEPKKAGPITSLASLPIYFTRNEGQIDPKVRYYLRGSSSAVYLTSEGMTFDLVKRPPTESSGPAGAAYRPGEPAEAKRLVFRVDLEGAREDVRIEGGDRQPGRVNYLIGADARTPTKRATRAARSTRS